MDFGLLLNTQVYQFLTQTFFSKILWDMSCHKMNINPFQSSVVVVAYLTMRLSNRVAWQQLA